MEENTDKANSIEIITHINELICQTQVTQYFKNPRESPIELEIILPKLSDCFITKFEMIKNNQKVVSKLLEKERAEIKYNDTITTGYYSFISYTKKNETRICLGNIPAGEEVELKTYFFSHIMNKDLSYQAIFPVIFPNFVMIDPSLNDIPEDYIYEKQKVKGKIFINTRSKITRLVINGSKKFSKIEKKYSEDKTSVEIDIFKDNFSDKDIPGIVLFRTEQINDEILYYQRDTRKNKSYYMLQTTLFKPELPQNKKDEIDEDENKYYIPLLNNKKSKEKPKGCYIFLLDQSGSMNGQRIELSCKSLLLFLQSLNENCYFQLVGFGSDFQFFSEKPLEYNKENIKNLMNVIKKLKANRGGTELYKPLNTIYNDKKYDEYDMNKIIILLTDGQLFDKQQVVDLIAANSNKFVFNSIGIGECDRDLIKTTALVGNGYSYYLSDLKELNSVVISVLDKNQNGLILDITTNQKCLIEDINKKNINKNDYFTHGFILDDIDIRDIEFNIKLLGKEIKLSFDKNKIIKLPDGDNLGKLIVDNYLQKKCYDRQKRVELSKEYNILIGETAFYAKIVNEAPAKDKMVKITNKDKTAANNNTEPQIQNQNSINTKSDDNIYNDGSFGYDNDEDPSKGKKGFFNGLMSKIFNFENIIKRKGYKYEQKVIKQSKKKEDIQMRACADYDSCKNDYVDAEDNYKLDFIDNYTYSGYFENDYDCGLSPFDRGENLGMYEDKKDKIIINKKNINFDELILSQDIIEGYWTKDEQSEILIDQEKDMYSKFKEYCEKKEVKDENGIITLLVLFYIYNKKKDKVDELKFVINKAKNYVNNIFNLEYDDIIKEIETK